jgi:hypothetical protein
MTEPKSDPPPPPRPIQPLTPAQSEGPLTVPTPKAGVPLRKGESPEKIR